MKKIVSTVAISLAVVAMLLPVISPVNLSISNVPGERRTLRADGGPNPIPPSPPTEVLMADGGPNPIPPSPPTQA
jgi:hypothetical protein